MAANLRRPGYEYLGGAQSSRTQDSTDNEDDDMEFDESQVWNTGRTPSPDQLKDAFPSSRTWEKPASKKNLEAVTATSLPVNIPDWSKILRDDYRLSQRKESEEEVEEEEEEEEEESRIPPHEYLARTRVASFSVHEGIGRTLKGRDLSRVRNAIWKTVGFED